MGAKESTAFQKPPDDQHLLLDKEGYSLVLDAEKNLVESHGDEAENSQSADRVLGLEIHGMGSAPVLHLKIAEHKSATDKYLYEDGMNRTAGMAFFLFRLPETYPGGRAGLLRIVRDLCDEIPTLGVTKIVPGRAAVKIFIKRSRKYPQMWEDPIFVNGIKVDWKRKRPGSKRLHMRVVFPGAQEGTNMIVLDESSEQLKAVTSGDLPKFIDAFILPLRIYLGRCTLRKRYHEELARLQKQPPAIQEGTSPDGQDAESKSIGSADQASELEVTMSAPRHGDCAASTTSYQTAHSFLSPSTTTPTSSAFHTPLVHSQTSSILDISEDPEPSSMLENPTSTENTHTSLSQDKSPIDTDHDTSIMEATSRAPGSIPKSHDIHLPAGVGLGDQADLHPSGDIHNNHTSHPPPGERPDEQVASRTSGEKQQHDRTSIPDLVEEGSNIQAEQTETSTNLKPSKQVTDSRKASRAEPTTQPADSNLELEQSNTNDEESQSDSEVSLTTAIQAGERPSTRPTPKPLSKKAKIKRMKKSRKRRFRGKKHRTSNTSQDTASQSDTETDENSEQDEAGDSPRTSQVQLETTQLATTSEASPELASAIKKSKGRQRTSNILIPVLQKSSTATGGPSSPSDTKIVQQGQDLVREDPETTTTPTLTAAPEEATPSSTTTVLATHGDSAPTRSPSTAMGLSPDNPNPAGGDLIIQTPPGFVWELTKVSFPCAKMDCRRASNLWDGRSVICPKCGPYSLIRYCGRDHLREDVSQHWNDCDKYSFQHPCVPGSVPPEVLSGPPQLPCRHRWDSPERHRQAMLFSTARREDGDYVLFAEWPLAIAAGGDPRECGRRCSPRAFLAARWDDPVARDRFRRVLAICLFSALEVQTLVGFMFRLVRDNLRHRGLWSVEVDHMLRSQIHREHGVNLQPPTKGQHHASGAEWIGLDTRSRQDPTYVNDVPLLGNLGVGFRRLCDLMESRFWILRASRTTHPFVQSVDARTRGEGFAGVRGEERRTFRRGEGWDGVGTGPLELEGEP